MKIESIKDKIENLNVNQKRELINYIKSTYSIFDEHHTDISICPHCGSKNIIKNGTRNGINRFLCKECNKSFTYKSKSVLSGIHKLNKWNDFVDDFLSLNISSLKTIKKKLNVSEQTVFNWRQKLISAMNIESPSFNNEDIEFDEAYFMISRKGRKLNLTDDKRAYKHWRRNQVGDSNYNVKLFFAYGRKQGNLELYKSHMGRTSKEDLKKYFGNERFNNSNIYTDKHPTYKSYFKDNINDLNHETFLAKQHINFQNPIIHNQTVNAYTKGFKDFVNRHLKGVSTKYLGTYAKWYEFIVQVKGFMKYYSETNNKLQFDMTNLICKKILEDKEGLMTYRETELSFLKFLRNNNRTNYGNCNNHYYSKYVKVISEFEEIHSVLQLYN